MLLERPLLYRRLERKNENIPPMRAGFLLFFL